MVGRDIMDGAEEQSTSRSRVRVKAFEDRDEVIVRIDRKPGSGRADCETLYLSFGECDALRIALMNEID